MSQNLSVRELAEFVCRSGDLYSRAEGRRIDALDGIRAQEVLRERRKNKYTQYSSEVAFKHDFTLANEETTLSGRADGLLITQKGCVLEEYKACGKFPVQPNQVDVGQLMIYGAMLAMRSELSIASLKLIYVQADTFEEKCFSYEFDNSELKQILAFMLLCFDLRRRRHWHRTAERHSWLAHKKFPYPDFRFGQRALAGRVYEAVENGERLLIESPTGSGKTMGTIYPSLKGMKHLEKLFYLTSRNSGSIAAMKTIDLIDPEYSNLVSIEIVAKEKLCPVEGMPCDSELCSYAKGYFDRSKEAVGALLEKKFISQRVVETVSEEHRVCPFEISLDASLWADIVVCDYNYVFDPFVRLQRFQPPRGIHLLIDEAHQLFPRVNSMFTVELDSLSLQDAITEADPRLHGSLNLVQHEFLALKACSEPDRSQIEAPQGFNKAILSFLETIRENEIELEGFPSLRDFVFACHRWSTALDWEFETSFEYIIECRDDQILVTRSCIDSSEIIHESLGKYESSIAFSGTLSPLSMYQELHGGETNLTARSPNPFAKDQLEVMLVNDIPTYYQMRRDSLGSLIRLVNSVLETKKGRYLIAFPSFQYMDLFLDELSCTKTADHQIISQMPGAKMEEIQELLQSYQDTEACLLTIVLGGVLGESIDFIEFPIEGVFVVSIGLPPKSIERNLLADRFAKLHGHDSGQAAAYFQPALNKVLQVCGRLIRSSTHRGIIYLIDARYLSGEIQKFFPSHWRPTVVSKTKAAEITRRFWQIGE